MRRPPVPLNNYQCVVIDCDTPTPNTLPYSIPLQYRLDENNASEIARVHTEFASASIAVRTSGVKVPLIGPL